MLLRRLKTAKTLLTLPFRNGYIFILCVALVFMQLGFHAANRDQDRANAAMLLGKAPHELREELLSRARGIIDSPPSQRHPIAVLMEQAEARYRTKIGRQSTTLKQAVAEYKKRYKRPPPKGFDEWWSFAKRHEVKLVDEYDGLIQDLEPFWKLNGTELRRRAMQAGHLPFVDLVRIRDGVTQTLNFRNEGVSGRAEGFRSVINKFASKLPDMDFPINGLSDSRVLVPWELQRYPNITGVDSSAGLGAMLGGPFRADWADDGNVWEAWRRTCHPSSAARRIFSSLQSDQGASPYNYFSPSHPSVDPFFHFANNIAEDDYCHAPQLHLDHGHFYTDWRSVHALYPIFSPAKARGYLDIRIPSHYYYGNTPRYTYGWDYVNLEMRDVDMMEVPWEEKANKVFWRGATSGGGNHPPRSAHRFHRHRFLEMASDTSERNVTLVFPFPEHDNKLVTAAVPIYELNEEVMDVAFVKAVAEDIYPGGLEAMEARFRFADAVELGRHWGFKYLLDLDGAGYSARFMAFLASDSVPLKASIYKEFYEDWIEPWLHYIPLTQSYQEVYNIHAYFSGPTESTLNAALGEVAELSGDEQDQDVAARDDGGVSHPPLQTQPQPQPQPRPTSTRDRQLRRIARAGKQWKKTSGRHVDIEVYVYRLCLEWARLLADDRDSMSF